ncbi:class I SAM-dependent methyltransferase [Actinacidiphila yeochonensis]|uniref:class I SAM-dependent methyltransferase n=1 Tax=Actinacidiphila yeochonensis TaxID=89050 RepID=UPI00056426DB|nr:class I SAM-dependent methyltransferase [Actinacidiphila yeochonensis]
MPTLPSGEDAPHRHRRIAESFGADAARYDRARPRYPDALVAAVAAAAAGRDLLDVGCGTGIAARQFQQAGYRVLGVEPDSRMAELARRTGVEVDLARFEEWRPGGRSFDAVTAAQAWHWVDPVAGAAAAARALRPGGVLAVFWNAFQPPPGVAAAFADAFAREAPDSPFAAGAAGAADQRAAEPYRALATKAVDGIRAAAAFEEPVERRFTWEWTYTRDAWLDVLPTQGSLTRLGAGPRARVLDAVAAAVDAIGGAFTMPYTTVAVMARRFGAGG